MACCVSWDALGLSNRKYVGGFLEENNILEWQRIGKPSKAVDKLYCTMSQEEYNNCVRKKLVSMLLWWSEWLIMDCLPFMVNSTVDS